MGIEQNIKSIRSHQTSSRAKTAGEIKALTAWTVKHSKENNKQFKAIGDALRALPTQEIILESIRENIKKVVNGKIDRLTIDVAGVAEHLKEQDKSIETINSKIKPVVGGLDWLSTLIRAFLWLGGIAAAAYGILKVLEIIKIIK